MNPTVSWWKNSADSRTIKQYLCNVHYTLCFLKYTCLLIFSYFIKMLLFPLKICSLILLYLSVQKKRQSLSMNLNAAVTREDRSFISKSDILQSTYPLRVQPCILSFIHSQNYPVSSYYKPVIVLRRKKDIAAGVHVPELVWH